VVSRDHDARLNFEFIAVVRGSSKWNEVFWNVVLWADFYRNIGIVEFHDKIAAS